MNSSSVIARLDMFASQHTHLRFSFVSSPPLDAGVIWSSCADLSSLRPVNAQIPRCDFHSPASCSVVALPSPLSFLALIQKNLREAYALSFSLFFSRFLWWQALPYARAASGFAALLLAMCSRFAFRMSSIDFAINSDLHSRLAVAFQSRTCRAPPLSSQSPCIVVRPGTARRASSAKE